MSPRASTHLVLSCLALDFAQGRVQGGGCRQRCERDAGEAGRGLLISNAALLRDISLAGGGESQGLAGTWGEDVSVPFWESMQTPFPAAHVQPISCPEQLD